MTVEEWAKDFKAFVNELQIPRDDYKGIIAYIEDGAKLLKAQGPKTVKEMLVVGGHLMGKCPRCCKILTVQDHPIACGFCGQAVKWQ